MTAEKAAKKPDPLGRLKTFGLEHPWQAAFFLPSGYDDMRKHIDAFETGCAADGAWSLFAGRIQGFDTRIDKGAPRIVGYLADAAGRRAGFVFFGDIKNIQKSLNEQSGTVYLNGQVSWLNNQLWIKSPEIVHSNWVGRVRPKYLSKPRVITPEMSRSRVLDCMKGESIQVAAEWLEKALGMPANEIAAFSKTGASSLDALLRKAHQPDSPNQGMRAQAGIERIAALGIARKANREQPKPGSDRIFDDLESAFASVPFTMTEEQQAASRGIVRAFRCGRLHVMLSGDVGTGKTVVYGAVMAAALAAGMSVACLLPNQALGEQIFREITSYWPDFPCILVTGDTPESINLTEYAMVIGTSALLFRDVGHRDLVVVDEQQKFARHQREKLLSPTSMLLESTATCVPRTQALMHFGGIDVFRLMKCHVKKDIKTRIWNESEKAGLFAGIKATLTEKGKVLIVYPKREASEDTGEDAPDYQMPSAEEAFVQWDRLFPGRVRLAHGGLDDAVNLAAIRDLREGVADILVATSLVEVGITIPSLRRVVVVHAERFGLSTLHQIRGRVARDGGVGYCDLYLPKRVKEETFARLNVLVRTADGFEVAREDMKQRGFGDLSAESLKQTGADDTFLFGRGLPMDVLDQVMQELEF